MKRRNFIRHSVFLSSGLLLYQPENIVNPFWNNPEDSKQKLQLYDLFRNPESKYYPFVRWWWNGNKIEAKEIIRELHILKDAGIGGVEINPIAFPSTGDDMGKKSLRWLSPEWIKMLQVAITESKKLDLTCDLLVGSGWPYGSESLTMEERAQVVIVFAEKITDPKKFEISTETIFKTIDPGVTVQQESRTFEITALKLSPDPITDFTQVVDLSHKKEDKVIQIEVPDGNFVFYALVNVKSFASVINGAPGASGPVLDHMNKKAVRKFLDNMSNIIQEQTGPLSNHLRAFFTDSMELEGSNWCDDFANEFKNRNGYDVLPFLPLFLFKTGRLGGVIDENYGAAKSLEIKEILGRIRFDFENTKAELLYERFTKTYLEWCRDLGVKSRAQAYGRGFFPLETSLDFDIPEGESWSTNWLKHKVGEEMPDDDYRRGRAYTMINKYVSSAAHLSSKQTISCEEMTNTYQVFNETLEMLKVGSDQSIISGITHSIWHGFNYSPPDAPFPGWIQYGSWYHPKNIFWSYFKLLNEYKARISAILQNTVMIADIAILPANNDLWSEMGVQTDPFPEKLNVPYTSLIWEAIHKTGGGADYTSEKIICNSTVYNGNLCYGNRKYSTLFLVEVKSIRPRTLEKLVDFVNSGGRIFCIEKYPEKSPGYTNYIDNDKQVKIWIDKLKQIPERFILVKKPSDNKFLEWYCALKEKHFLPSFIKFEKPDRFVSQIHYQGVNSEDIFFIANSNNGKSFSSEITFSNDIPNNRFGWIWNPETGERFRIYPKKGRIELLLGPSESRIIIFDTNKYGKKWKAIPVSGKKMISLEKDWEIEFLHHFENISKGLHLPNLLDLKETELVNFAGTVIYRKNFEINSLIPDFINIGKAWGISEVFLNGESLGIKWYGNRIYKAKNKFQKGLNRIEIRIFTTMGNYMKTLTNNETAQKFSVLKNKNQPVQSMGLLGPVTLY